MHFILIRTQHMYYLIYLAASCLPLPFLSKTASNFAHQVSNNTLLLQQNKQFPLINRTITSIRPAMLTVRLPHIILRPPPLSCQRVLRQMSATRDSFYDVHIHLLRKMTSFIHFISYYSLRKDRENVLQE